MSAGSVPTYDGIGRDYARRRVPDPRVAEQIDAALGDAAVVANVGAGTGAYEPGDRRIIPIEPSTTMIAQRDPGRTPAVRAVAESLPLADGSVDAALAVLTVHHWADQVVGLRELQRVSVDRVVVLTWDETVSEQRFWMLRDYLPEVMASERARCPSPAMVESVLGPCRTEAVPIPVDCTDGFFAAFWGRPEAYLDADVRAGISTLAQADQGTVGDAVAHLGRDLVSGAWTERYAELADRDALDLGYRLVVAPA